MKQLGRKGLMFDRLITPTLKVAGSNPVGRTKRKSFEPQGFQSFFLFVPIERKLSEIAKSAQKKRTTFMPYRPQKEG